MKDHAELLALRDFFQVVAQLPVPPHTAEEGLVFWHHFDKCRAIVPTGDNRAVFAKTLAEIRKAAAVQPMVWL